ncbi:MAG: class I SAM-dependent methyltransferase [Anaerolineae bacterium]|nr:class I SAM-dependent methyltransferase [Anaerolineae bacterium]
MQQPEYEWMYHYEDWHWWFTGRRRMAQALFERHIPAASTQLILDIGCGTGGNLELLARWGSVIGLDLSSLALNLARRRRPSSCLVQGSGLTLPYPNHTFTLVTAFDVLYHRWITDDHQALAECYRILQPGGWLLLTDSALPGLHSVHDEIYCARQRYTLADIRKKLAKAGFQLQTCSYTNSILLPVVTMVRLAARRLPSLGRLDSRPLPAWLNRWLIGVQTLEAKWLRQGRTLPLGSSLICLTQKPLAQKNKETVKRSYHHETS